jgi:hypothetical protein
MTTHRAIACALALTIAATTSVWGAEKKKKTVKKPVGRTETLACKLGTEDRHARIAVVVIKGKTDSFAYYSKWKPRTCSIYLERNRDPYSKWADTGDVTTVSLEKGAFLIEHKPGEYHFIFRDVDRERYCGMDGVINGTLTIKRGKDQCVLGGEIMAEGTPLGHVPAAYASVETQPPAAGASDIPAAIATPASATPAGQAAAATAEAAAPKTAASGSGAVKSAGGAAASISESAPAAAAKEQAVAEPADSEIGVAESAREEASAADAGETRTASAEPPAQRAKAPAAEPADDPSKTAQRPPLAAPQAGPDAPTTTAASEPESEAPSGNPLRSFFRALAPRSPEEATPFPN